MPYLHWETDRRRSKFDEIIRNITEEHKEKEDKKLAKARCKVPAVPASTAASQNGKSKSLASPPPAAKKHGIWLFGKRENNADPLERPQTNESAPKSFKPLHTFTDVVEAKVKATTKERPPPKPKAEKGKKPATDDALHCLGQGFFPCSNLVRSDGVPLRPRALARQPP
jgi:hypothetical protein